MTDTVFEARLGDGRQLRSGEGGSVLEWDIQSNYMTATDGWSLAFKTNSYAERKNLELMPIELYQDGRLQVVGRIDGDVRGGRGTVVEIKGRDYFADLTQCHIDPLVTIKEGMRLDQAIIMALSPMGIVAIEEPENGLTGRVGRPPSHKLPKLVKADLKNCKVKDGDGAFEWCNQLAARHAYMLQPSVNRRLVSIEAPNYLQTPQFDITRLDANGAGGNVFDGIATRDYSTVPTFSKMVGKAGKAGEREIVTTKEWDLHAIAAGMGTEVFECVSRWCVKGRRKPVPTPAPIEGDLLYRLQYWKDKNAKTPAQIGAAVWRAACDELKKTLSYDVTLYGTKDPVNGATYSTNTLATVNDAVADVYNEILWCYENNRGGSASGTLSHLKFIRPGSFQIDTEGHGG